MGGGSGIAEALGEEMHGTFRFFRVESGGITESDQDCGQLVVAVPGLRCGSKTSS